LRHRVVTSVVNRYYDPATGQFVTVDPWVAFTGQPYDYSGNDPVNGLDPLGLCTIGEQGLVYPGPCATTAAEAIAAEQEIQAASQHTGILGDIESGVEHDDPFYAALRSYDNEYHAAQDGCSFSTVFGFAADAVVADVETGAGIDGEGEVADTVDALDEELPSVIYREGTPRPGNLTPRGVDDGALSFRDSLSNPIDSANRPVFRPGEQYIGVDAAQLPPGSVIFDDVPPGHVSVAGLSAQDLQQAVVERDTFPK
jgi:uncharacterized protein RhaS with RHS repeats